MTTKPPHVRLEVMVDGEHPERCSAQCPSSGNMDYCHAFMVYRVRRGAVMRDAKCVESATADALNAAVVEAAVALRAEDFST